MDLKMKGAMWIEDALTGEKLSNIFFTKPGAEARLKQLKRKHPAAFIKEAKDHAAARERLGIA